MPAHPSDSATRPLRNLGPVSLRWLAAIGVTTREDLERLGAIEAFLRVRDAGFRPSKNLLWALKGALLDVRWDELPSELKAQLWREVEGSS
ncbi:MAG: TfoX/Sxy family protein [Thermoanaerobaculia bacterium]|nr:TfoX/Sxy family protein [Thermoanaerobaculia bacterium]